MFRLRAYGGLTLERDGAPYAGPATQRRRLAVLAMIAASDTGVSRERLADYLWPDADPARGRHSLDDALSGLRRELRSDELFIGVATLRLNAEALECDLADQAAALACGDAERAAALYAGPFLDGFSIPGAADFEQWIEAERIRRARAHARVLEDLAANAAARNDAATATRWCAGTNRASRSTRSTRRRRSASSAHSRLRETRRRPFGLPGCTKRSCVRSSTPVPARSGPQQ
jgi:DNA-binding SARP family transcriptional activator